MPVRKLLSALFILLFVAMAYGYTTSDTFATLYLDDRPTTSSRFTFSDEQLDYMDYMDSYHADDLIDYDGYYSYSDLSYEYGYGPGGW